MDKLDLGWKLFVELRKEIVESQKIRAQIIGVKITLVSGAVGYILSNLEKIPVEVLVIPAFAAVFFDLLINSYSFSIKRLGTYCRVHIEERLIMPSIELPEGFVLWQEFMRQPGKQQSLSTVANLGLTALAMLPAFYEILGTIELRPSIGLVLMLLIAFACDWWMFRNTSLKGRLNIGDENR